MSILDKIIKEQYPHEIRIPADAKRCKEIREWCRDNIYEYDTGNLYETNYNKDAIGIIVRCTNGDDWILTKLKWAQ